MTIKTAVQNNSVLLHATDYGTGMSIQLWLGPLELQKIFGELCRWKNCKCLIEADRVRFLHDGEAAAAPVGDSRQRELTWIGELGGRIGGLVRELSYIRANIREFLKESESANGFDSGDALDLLNAVIDRCNMGLGDGR